MLCYLNKILSQQVNAELGRAQSGLVFKKLRLNNALLGPTDKNATTSILRVLSSICFACQGWGQAWRNLAWIIAHEGFGKDHNVLLGLQQLSDERPKSNHRILTHMIMKILKISWLMNIWLIALFWNRMIDKNVSRSLEINQVFTYNFWGIYFD